MKNSEHRPFFSTGNISGSAAPAASPKTNGVGNKNGDRSTFSDLPRFNLSDLYSSINDPKIEADLILAIEKAEEFKSTYSGRLSESLGSALSSLQELNSLTHKLFVYLHLSLACDGSNERLRQVLSRVQERWAQATANSLNFFEHELGSVLTDDDYQELIDSDATVQHHKPYIDQVRLLAKHLLPPDVERALILRSPFGPSEWKDYLKESEVSLRFRVRHPIAPQKSLTLTEILNLTLHHADSDLRFSAMQVLNRGLKKSLAPVATRALNCVMGKGLVEASERGYPHPMAARNLENQLPDAMVEALHAAVRTEGSSQAKRYYKLLATHLGKRTLRWSDRTAKVSSETRKMSWNEALSSVVSAWQTFSPSMAQMIGTMVDSHWVDVPPGSGKQAGAFNYSVILPSPHGIRTYTLLNFLGSDRDVMTIAHEFGHGVHGLLAAQQQGELLFQAPLAYAETASIFGEMLVFEHLLARTSTGAEKLALLMDKSSDLINSVVRQISFSVFEQRAHELRRQQKLTTKDLCGLWLDVTSEFYGREGDIFNFSDIDYLWSYVSHFMSPFYVYAYAFGELLTQSLFAARKDFGPDFESKYLDLLRAGGSKNAIELLKPFGLDPRDPTFWERGLKGSIGSWLDQAEALTTSLAHAP